MAAAKWELTRGPQSAAVATAALSSTTGARETEGERVRIRGRREGETKIPGGGIGQKLTWSPLRFVETRNKTLCHSVPPRCFDQTQGLVGMRPRPRLPPIGRPALYQTEMLRVYIYPWSERGTYLAAYPPTYLPSPVHPPPRERERERV